MTPEQKQHLKDTWRQVVPIADTAMTLFYDRLFTLDPALKPMFANADMAQQRNKLAQALGRVVGSLDDLDAIVPVLQDLGRRHTAYGVEDRHYDTVGAALIWTLEQGLGEALTDDARTAWVDAYGLVAGVMRGAGAEAAPIAARA